MKKKTEIRDNANKPKLQLTKKDLQTLDKNELKVAIGGWPGSDGRMGHT